MIFIILSTILCISEVIGTLCISSQLEQDIYELTCLFVNMSMVCILKESHPGHFITSFIDNLIFSIIQHPIIHLLLFLSNIHISCILFSLFLEYLLYPNRIHGCIVSFNSHHIFGKNEQGYNNKPLYFPLHRISLYIAHIL